MKALHSSLLHKVYESASQAYSHAKGAPTAKGSHGCCNTVLQTDSEFNTARHFPDHLVGRRQR